MSEINHSRNLIIPGYPDRKLQTTPSNNSEIILPSDTPQKQSSTTPENFDKVNGILVPKTVTAGQILILDQIKNTEEKVLSSVEKQTKNKKVLARSADFFGFHVLFS